MIETLKVIRFKAGYELRCDKLSGSDVPGDCKPMTMHRAFNPDGDYIGDNKTARYLVVKKGIMPQKSQPDHCVCSIGYSPKDGKWYGWSHRAIYGFKVGSVVKKGDCGFGRRKKPWVAKTTAEARQMAINFAESVS